MTRLHYLKDYLHYLVLLGFGLWLSAYLLPDDLLVQLLSPRLPLSTALISMVIPKIGFVALFLSLAFRRYYLALASLLLVCSPMIALALVYAVRG